MVDCHRRKFFYDVLLTCFSFCSALEYFGKEPSASPIGRCAVQGQTQLTAQASPTGGTNSVNIALSASIDRVWAIERLLKRLQMPPGSGSR